MDMKESYPIQMAKYIIANYKFELINSRLINWATSRIKRIKRVLRHIQLSVRGLKARKGRPNKMDRGHEIPNNDTDCDRIDSQEGNTKWRDGTKKEIQKLLDYEFGEFYPDD